MKKFALTTTGVLLLFAVGFAQQSNSEVSTSPQQKEIKQQKAENNSQGNSGEGYHLTTGERQKPLTLTTGELPSGTAQNAENAGAATTTNQNQGVVFTVEDYDRMIFDIETKMNYVKNHPEEYGIAMESGWWQNAEKLLAEYKQAREELIAKQTK